MTALARIFLLFIVCIFSYKALLGICVWYREKFDNLELPSQMLKNSTDDILMGLIVFITVLVSSQIGKRMGK